METQLIVELDVELSVPYFMTLSKKTKHTLKVK